MKNIWLIIKGIFMGVANIVPGLSGGTIAVSLGIYDDIIRSIATIKSEMKKKSPLFYSSSYRIITRCCAFFKDDHLSF